ncbi:MAG: type IV toxin-antitoxin system AbiEi family antitoxin domain-containing protein [Pseudonocardiales bacterium]
MNWRDIARAQDGVVSRLQLLGRGVSPAAIGRLSARGLVDRIAHGLYLVGGAPATYRAQLWVVVLATDGVLGYGTAAELWGVSADRADCVHVIVAHARRVTAPARTVVHRVGLPATEVRARDGLPVSTRARTVVDQLGALPRREALRLADRALQRQWITSRDLERWLREFPGRPGNTQLRWLLSSTSDGAAAESERRLHRMLHQAGVRGWQANHPVWVDGELVAVIDVALVAARIAIEVDGMAYHVDVDRFRRDRWRQNDLVSLGWKVLRFTWADLTDRPGYVLARIRRLAA